MASQIKSALILLSVFLSISFSLAHRFLLEQANDEPNKVDQDDPPHHAVKLDGSGDGNGNEVGVGVGYGSGGNGYGYGYGLGKGKGQGIGIGIGKGGKNGEGIGIGKGGENGDGEGIGIGKGGENGEGIGIGIGQGDGTGSSFYVSDNSCHSNPDCDHPCPPGNGITVPIPQIPPIKIPPIEIPPIPIPRFSGGSGCKTENCCESGKTCLPDIQEQSSTTNDVAAKEMQDTMSAAFEPKPPEEIQT